MVYDIAKLSKLNGLDAGRAMRSFPSVQTYFEMLDRFLDESQLYLNAYTPSVVVYSEDMREDFLLDLENVRENLVSLGMVGLAATLYDLEQAIKSGSAKALSDGLLVFHSETDIMCKNVRSARQPEA